MNSTNKIYRAACSDNSSFCKGECCNVDQTSRARISASAGRTSASICYTQDGTGPSWLRATRTNSAPRNAARSAKTRALPTQTTERMAKTWDMSNLAGSGDDRSGGGAGAGAGNDCGLCGHCAETEKEKEWNQHHSLQSQHFHHQIDFQLQAQNSASTVFPITIPIHPRSSQNLCRSSPFRGQSQSGSL